LNITLANINLFFIILFVNKSLTIEFSIHLSFFFGDINLVKDAFLRSKMDEQGWVPGTLIADFPSSKLFVLGQTILLAYFV